MRFDRRLVTHFEWLLPLLVIAVCGLGTLTIYSATDVREMSDLLEDFKRLYPKIVVQYEDLTSSEVYKRMLSDAAAGRIVADLVINSAMGLQIKLVNDGYVQSYASLFCPVRPTLCRR